MPDDSAFLDATYEYDTVGKCLSGIYLDNQYNVIGTIEWEYSLDGKNIVYRIERDNQGNELNKIHNIYNNDGLSYRVDIFNHGVLVEYGLYTYLS